MSEIKHNLPSPDKDQAIADRIFAQETEDIRQKEIDRLYETEVQPATEDYERIRRLGFVSRKESDAAITKILERMDAKDKQIDQLLTLLKKKAAQGENPVGRGTIEAPESKEEEDYRKLVEEFGNLDGYVRPPKALIPGRGPDLRNRR